MATIDAVLVGDGDGRRHVGKQVFSAKVALSQSVLAKASAFVRLQENDCYLPLMGDVVTAEPAETWLPDEEIQAINDAIQVSLGSELALSPCLKVGDLCLAGLVAFHNDVVLANEDDGLTFVLVLKDSTLEFAFADGRRFPLKAGDFYLFDLALPHAVLPAGTKEWTNDWQTDGATATFEQTFLFAAGCFPPSLEQLPYVGASLAQPGGPFVQFGGLATADIPTIAFVSRTDGELATA